MRCIGVWYFGYISTLSATRLKLKYRIFIPCFLFFDLYSSPAPASRTPTHTFAAEEKPTRRRVEEHRNLVTQTRAILLLTNGGMADDRISLVFSYFLGLNSPCTDGRTETASSPSCHILLCLSWSCLVFSSWLHIQGLWLKFNFFTPAEFRWTCVCTQCTPYVSTGSAISPPPSWIQLALLSLRHFWFGLWRLVPSMLRVVSVETVYTILPF